MSAVSKLWVFSVFLSLLVMLLLGLSLVWLRIERVDLAYILKQKQTELDNKESLVAKLVVERNTYLTPERLRQVAKAQGLGPVRPGQMRKLSEAGEEIGSPLAAQSQAKPAEPKGKAKAKQTENKEALSQKKSGKAGKVVQAAKDKPKIKSGEQIQMQGKGAVKPEPVIEN